MGPEKRRTWNLETGTCVSNLPVKILESGESKFIRNLKLVILIQPNTAKYVHSPNLLKRAATGYQFFEPFT